MKAIPRNLFIIFLSDGISRLLGFVTTIIIARALAIEGFGLISYGMAFLNYAILAMNPGLTVIGAREIAKDHTNSSIVEEVQGLRVMLMIIVFVLFGIGLLLFKGSIQTKHIIMLYLITAIPFSFQLEYVFQGRQEMFVVGLSRFIQALVYLVAVYGLLRFMDILGVPLAFVFSYAASSLILFSMYLKKYKRIKINLAFSRWNSIIKASIPVGLATVLNQITLNLPAIILGIFTTNIDVGAYSAAYKIILMLLIIERVFHYVFFPVLTRQYKENPAQLRSSFTLLTKVMAVITSLVLVICFIFTRSIIVLVFGAGYEQSVAVFQILLLYFLLSPLNSIYGYGLVAIDQEKKFMQVITLSSIVSSVLMLLLVQFMKSQGAALALVIGEFLSIMLMTRELMRYQKFSIWTCLRGPILALLLSGVVILLLSSLPLIHMFVIVLLIFSLILVITAHFDKGDRLKLMQHLSGKTKGLP